MRRRVHSMVLILAACGPLYAASPATGNGPPREREICAPGKIVLTDGTSFGADRIVVVGDSLRTFTDLEIRLLFPEGNPTPGHPVPVPVRQAFSLNRVTRVECTDPLGNGALIGFLAGGIPLAVGAAIGVAGSEPDVSALSIIGAAATGLGIGGAVGGVFGAILDATIRHRIERSELLGSPPD